jgi:hypothetical protein
VEATMKWFLTVAVRWRPASMEWEYKNVVSKKPPEEWLADRIEAVHLASYGRQEVCVLYAREISDETATSLEDVLHKESQEV